MFALSFAPKMTEIFNKVQEISSCEGMGHNLSIIKYRDL
jgi:hypothetical protein